MLNVKKYTWDFVSLHMVLLMPITNQELAFTVEPTLKFFQRCMDLLILRTVALISFVLACTDVILVGAPTEEAVGCNAP